jgi:hypothetical protein
MDAMNNHACISYARNFCCLQALLQRHYCRGLINAFPITIAAAALITVTGDLWQLLHLEVVLRQHHR